MAQEKQGFSIAAASIAHSIRFYIRALKARYRDQKAELSIIRQYVRPTDVVCDIGANKGSFVFWLARWCPDGSVVAFEPQPNFSALLRTVCRRLKNVTIEPKAVYSRSGEFQLHVPHGHPQGASLSEIGDKADCSFPVPAISLDDYFTPHQKVALLKIDVEGAELEVFKGATRILREQSPLLLFECEGRHLKDNGDVNSVFLYLSKLGYEGYFICGDRILPIVDFNDSIHQSQNGEWFWKRSDYCNNFVFAKVENLGLLKQFS